MPADSMTFKPRNTIVRELDERRPLWQAHSINPGSEICEVCEAVLYEVLWPVEEKLGPFGPRHIITEKPRDVQVGWIDSLVATKDCALCQYFVRRFTLKYPRNQLSDAVDDRRFFCYLPLSCFTQRTPAGVRLDWLLQIKFKEYDLGSRNVKTLQTWDHDFMFAPTLTLLAESTTSVAVYVGELPGPTVFRRLARRVARDWEPEIMSRALRACLETHGELCDAPHSLTTHKWMWPESDASNARLEILRSATALRVIDVFSMCIRALPEESPYLALSYCWSRQPFVTLTLANIDELSRPGGLHVGSLVPTIADAVAVTASMGMRYLWVDALCIVQDSPDDKLHQLTQMDKVYRGTCVTIVAAGIEANDQDLGLPGVRPGSREPAQDIVSIRGLSFAQCNTAKWKFLRKTRWSSRAWTYQEFLLSKRLLVFTSQHVRFACECDVVTEDYVSHFCPNPGDADEEIDAGSTTLGKLVHNGVQKVPNHASNYETFVTNFMARNLSYEGDVLNAICGITNVMAQEWGEKFLCGLPVTNLLGCFTHWYPMSNIHRRKPSISGQLFPAWSWAEWVGHLTYNGDQSELSTGTDGTVRRTSLEMSVPSVADLSILIDDGRSKSRIAVEDLSFAQLSSMETCILCFESAAVEFVVRPLTPTEWS